MTGRTTKNKSNSIDAPEVPAVSSFDIGELSGQLGRVTGALDQLQSDNRVLSDALTDTQRWLMDARGAEREAQKAISDGKRELRRMQALVERRDNEIVELEDELTKMRSERADWESVVLAERDAAIEEQVGDLAAARADVKALNSRIADIEDELALERQRTAPDTQLVQLMTTTGTTLLVDGEGLVETAWPHLAPERRRSRVIEAAGRFHQRHRVDVEVLLSGSEGWNPSAPAPAGVRVRVPHVGIPISACLTQLARVYGDAAPVVTVCSSATDEPWISSARAAALMGLPVPPAPENNQDLEPATEVEK